MQVNLLEAALMALPGRSSMQEWLQTTRPTGQGWQVFGRLPVDCIRHEVRCPAGGTVAITHAGLLADLKRLRRGWGVNGDLDRVLGLSLAEVCGITPDEEAQRRLKLTSHLTRIAGRLPDEMTLFVLVGLCLHPDAQFRELEEREDWLTDQGKGSRRTVIRRLDEAMGVFAEKLLQEFQLKESNVGWYVKSFIALVRADLEQPEAIETRKIVSLVDGLDTIETSVGVPRHPQDSQAEHGLHAELRYGGLLVSRDQLSESRFRNVIKLPRPLRAGQEHEYSLRLQVPSGQLLAPHYVHTPKRRTDYFEVRARFDAHKVPEAVWRLNGVPTTVIYESEPSGERLEVDPSGEGYVNFHDLTVGYCYGIRWS
jgi:hypothetical protein